ncbi:hypothetical protein PAPYR_8525 [Paratrimastix pyriformis]|uniref:Uncharacterized protein n=1 Tax=Paratrimastix pyriformis TaxID=342808 RepID=A0ABQ8UFW9_9EUKA|nr:hypothetical protein PAPYR_8525 [Paratrimastix pyriformis]
MMAVTKSVKSTLLWDVGSLPFVLHVPHLYLHARKVWNLSKYLEIISSCAFYSPLNLQLNHHSRAGCLHPAKGWFNLGSRSLRQFQPYLPNRLTRRSIPNLMQFRAPGAAAVGANSTPDDADTEPESDHTGGENTFSMDEERSLIEYYRAAAAAGLADQTLDILSSQRRKQGNAKRSDSAALLAVSPAPPPSPAVPAGQQQQQRQRSPRRHRRRSPFKLEIDQSPLHPHTRICIIFPFLPSLPCPTQFPSPFLSSTTPASRPRTVFVATNPAVYPPGTPADDLPPPPPRLPPPGLLRPASARSRHVPTPPPTPDMYLASPPPTPIGRQQQQQPQQHEHWDRATGSPTPHPVQPTPPPFAKHPSTAPGRPLALSLPPGSAPLKRRGVRTVVRPPSAGQLRNSEGSLAALLAANRTRKERPRPVRPVGGQNAPLAGTLRVDPWVIDTPRIGYNPPGISPRLAVPGISPRQGYIPPRGYPPTARGSIDQSISPRGGSEGEEGDIHLTGGEDGQLMRLELDAAPAPRAECQRFMAASTLVDPLQRYREQAMTLTFYATHITSIGSLPAAVLQLVLANLIKAASEPLEWFASLGLAVLADAIGMDGRCPHILMTALRIRAATFAQERLVLFVQDPTTPALQVCQLSLIPSACLFEMCLLDVLCLDVFVCVFSMYLF